MSVRNMNSAPNLPPVHAPGPLQDNDGELFDFRLTRDFAGFAMRSLRRHATVASAIFSSVFGLAIVLFFVLPRTWHTETRILAQRNLVMPALGNPRRAIPTESDAPTRSAAETVMKRDNLVALVKQTNLLDEWDGTRAPIVRLRDGVLDVFHKRMDDEDKLEALIGLLGKQLKVTTDEGTVTIGLDWNDPNMAFRLVEAAQQNFLEARHASEVSSIAETISILEGHAANVRETIDGTLDDLRKARLPAAAAAEQQKVRRSSDTPRKEGEGSGDKELTEIRVMLNAKRRAISDLEEFRQKRVAELQTTLAEQRQTYAPGHPALANTMQNIQALVAESPQIAQLKREEKELAAEYAQRGGKEKPEGPSRQVLNEVSQANLDRTKHKDDDDDDVVSYAKSRLKIAVANYEELLDRIEGARIELDTTRAAFKYRYSIIAPAQVPKNPEKPKAQIFVGIGIFLALALALLATTLLDLSSDRILESWQVERRLGIAVLGEVKKP